ncbi:hypothetical protein MMC08_003641 [Hypocenomyce scalaris]|nr:hypothetical protein [Hypocenomyce scalaris]
MPAQDAPNYDQMEQDEFEAAKGPEEYGDTTFKSEDNEDDVIPTTEHDEEDAGGLFGNGRKLDDEELDSGDDEGRKDRMEDDMDGYGEEAAGSVPRGVNILTADLGRHAGPRPSDGELYLLKFPHFLGIDPRCFHLKDFQPPTTDHHSSNVPPAAFSAYQTSNTTLRWRRSPNRPDQIQSNARILRWSDGSLTMQLASNATEQYELPAKPLAPPQRAPLKPTPTATNRGPKGAPTYDPRLDSHTYLIAPHELASIMRITNHVTTSLTVLPSSDQNDDALIRLQESLAAATKGNKTAADGGVGIINISEDPELAKKKAEVAEREKLRAQRRRQQQEERERDRANRVLGRSGLRTGGMGAGLTIGGLEDDDGMATTRARPSKPKRTARRRNSEYSDDEDDFRNRGRTKEDEYDEDDGFLVRSDEEPELVPDESEEEEEMSDDIEDEKEKRPRKGSPKRERATEGGEEAASGARQKRRRVVDDEDDQ